LSYLDVVDEYVKHKFRGFLFADPPYDVDWLSKLVFLLFTEVCL